MFTPRQPRHRSEVAIIAPLWQEARLRGYETACVRELELETNPREACSLIITKKDPTRAFSWLKVPTSAFTFKNLLRHYAKQALRPTNGHLHSQRFVSSSNVRECRGMCRIARNGANWSVPRLRCTENTRIRKICVTCDTLRHTITLHSSLI